MLNLLLRIGFVSYFAFDASKLLTSLLFEPGTKSYSISYYGLAFIFIPTIYTSLSKVFATRLLVIDKAQLEKQLEDKLKEKHDQN